MKIERPDPDLIPSFTAGAAYIIDQSWKGLDKLFEEWKKDADLDLDPDFQRDHKWTETQQRLYVEFALRGGKTGKELLFNCPGWHFGPSAGSMELVDGKQRLEAVRRFMANEVPIFGGWLERNFLPEIHRTHLPGFRIHVNDLATRAEVLDRYLEFNDGGEAHTEEELDRVRRLRAAEVEE